MITTLSRPFLTGQSVGTLKKWSADWDSHTLTVVVDGYIGTPGRIAYAHSTILLSESQGASASRNIGAASIPKYRRQEHVCFFDDDVWLAKGWDTAIEQVLDAVPGCIVSAYAHPYNHPLGLYNINGVEFHAAGVLSTVNMAMSWEMWDDIGFFKEPGGPSGSEDVDYCLRATGKGYGLATTHPHRLIHTGLVSSKGEKIVGHDLLLEQNRMLEKLYGVEGQVKYE